jgi:hypothetical protein
MRHDNRELCCISYIRNKLDGKEQTAITSPSPLCRVPAAIRRPPRSFLPPSPSSLAPSPSCSFLPSFLLVLSSLAPAKPAPHKPTLNPQKTPAQTTLHLSLAPLTTTSPQYSVPLKLTPLLVLSCPSLSPPAQNHAEQCTPGSRHIIRTQHAG